jgi:hypothetical protein
VRHGRTGFGGGEEEESAATMGRNPPNGVLVYYWLKAKPKEKEKLTVEILDGDKVIRTYTNEKKEREGAEGGGAGAGGGAPDDDRAEKPIEPKEGLNRLVWDMQIVKPTLVPKAIIWGSSQGPRVAPGKYSVRLQYAGQTLTQPIEVRAHPGVSASSEDLTKQFELLRASMDGLAAAHGAVAQIREAKTQIREIGERAEKLGKGKEIREKGKALSEKMTAIEKKLVNPDLKSNQDVLNFAPALDHQFAGLAQVASSADAKPTDASWTFLKETQGKLDAILAEWKGLQGKELAEFNALVREKEIPPVVVAPVKKD